MHRDRFARGGILALALALAVPLDGGPRPAAATVTVASAIEPAGVQGVARAPRRTRDGLIPELVAGVEAAPRAELAPDAPRESTIALTPEPPPPVRTARPAPMVPVLVPVEPQTGLVLASWYGPGFYGNRTACGQTYTPEIIGVAHKTLPCGALLSLDYGGRSITVPVIDRGPYVAGRTLDLSNATRLALGCPDLCRLTMRVSP
jgi:hypothetical protein